MKHHVLFLLIVGLFAASCTDRDDEINDVQIRIKNNSSILFEEVQVGDQETLHMNIGPGDYSDYLSYETAYRYAYISVTSGEETYILQPIDYVGETALPPGLYTYELNISEEGELLLVFSPD